MDPNRKETLEDYEKNARIMYYVGFGLLPLSWLMCWVYCTRRQNESEYLRKLGWKAFFLWWVAVFIYGAWTAIYHCYWTKMTAIGFSLPQGEPE